MIFFAELEGSDRHESVHAECVFSSDMDPHAQEIYQKNLGEKPEGDITQIDARDIPEQRSFMCWFSLPVIQYIGKSGRIFRCPEPCFMKFSAL